MVLQPLKGRLGGQPVTEARHLAAGGLLLRPGGRGEERVSREDLLSVEGPKPKAWKRRDQMEGSHPSVLGLPPIQQLPKLKKLIKARRQPEGLAGTTRYTSSKHI